MALKEIDVKKSKKNRSFSVVLHKEKPRWIGWEIEQIKLRGERLEKERGWDKKKELEREIKNKRDIDSERDWETERLKLKRGVDNCGIHGEQILKKIRFVNCVH